MEMIYFATYVHQAIRTPEHNIINQFVSMYGGRKYNQHLHVDTATRFSLLVPFS